MHIFLSGLLSSNVVTCQNINTAISSNKLGDIGRKLYLAEGWDIIPLGNSNFQNDLLSYVISLSWESFVLLQGKNIIFSSHVADNDLNCLVGQDVCDLYVSHNFTCYLSGDGKIQFKKPGYLEWKCVSGEDRIIKTISCGQTYAVGISDKSKAYLIEYLSSPDKQPLFTELGPPKLLIKAVSCGKEHILLLSNIGIIYSYGVGSRGQLGHGTVENVTSSASVAMVEALEACTVIDVAAGGWHSVAITDIGDVYTWGWNESGQLGLPCQNAQHETEHGNCVNVETLPCVLDLPFDCDEVKVVKASCGSRHTAVVTDTGELYTWGWNEYGQLGISTQSTETNESKKESKSGEFRSGKTKTSCTSELKRKFENGESKSGKTNTRGLENEKCDMKTRNFNTQDNYSENLHVGDSKTGNRIHTLQSHQSGKGDTKTGSEIKIQDSPKKVTALESYRVIDVKCGGWTTVVVAVDNKT